MNNNEEFIYDAFISYRHKELDMAVAKKLHWIMENYKIPASIRKQTGIRKIKKVFRDQEELPTSSNLSDGIQHALMHSKFLIVICSKDTPSSKWCTEEIESFRQMHGDERILSLLIDGEPDEAFPRALRYRKVRFETDDGNIIEEMKEIEPLAADIRGLSLKLMFQRLKIEKFRLLAPVLGVGFDDLRQRHRERLIKKTLTLVLAISFVLAAFGSYSLYQLNVISNKNRELAEQKKQAEENEAIAIEQKNVVLKNQSLYLAALSGDQLKSGNRYNALMLALEALPGDLNSPDRPYVAEAEVALRNAVIGYGIGKYTSDMTFQNEAEVFSVSFSHNAKFMTAGLKVAYPVLWDTQTGKKVAILNCTNLVTSTSFNADDSQVMLLSAMYFVSVWDTATGEELFRLFDHDRQVINTTEYTPDGKQIITGSEFGISVWDAQNGQKLSEYQTDSEVHHLKICRDGTLMAYVSDGITIRDLNTGHEIKLDNVKGGYPTNIEFSTDGRRLLVYSEDESLPGIWDTATGAKLTQPDYIASSLVTSSNISHNGMRVVTGYDNGKMIIWEIDTGKVTYESNDDDIKSVTSVMFSADDTMIISGVALYDSTATLLWNAETGDNIDKIQGTCLADNMLGSYPAVDSNGYIATADGNVVKMWTVGDVTEYGGRYSDSNISFNRDGSRIASSLLESNKVIVRDTVTGKELLQLSGHTQPILNIAFSPDDSKLAATGQDGQTIVWDAETGDKMFVLQCGAEDDYIWSANYNNDGSKLVTTGGNSIVIWDMSSGEEILRISGDIDYDFAQFNQDGSKLLVTASYEHGIAFVMNAESGQREYDYSGDLKYTLEAKYNNDGSRILFYNSEEAELWDANTYQLIRKLNETGEEINSAQFNEDGTKLVTTSNTNKVIIWNSENGEVEKQIGDFAVETTYAQFSPEGDKLCIISQGISIWDLTSDMEMTHIGTEGFRYYGITFCPSNDRLFATYPIVTCWKLGSLAQNMEEAMNILQGRTLSDEMKKKLYIE